MGEFLADIKKKFREGDKESVKVAELKKVRTRKQDHKGVCTRNQKSSEGK